MEPGRYGNASLSSNFTPSSPHEYMPSARKREGETILDLGLERLHILCPLTSLARVVYYQ